MTTVTTIARLAVMRWTWHLVVMSEQAVLVVSFIAAISSITLSLQQTLSCTLG